MYTDSPFIYICIYIYSSLPYTLRLFGHEGELEEVRGRKVRKTEGEDGGMWIEELYIRIDIGMRGIKWFMSSIRCSLDI